jgi:uncharacterized protein (TIGR00730 family)
LGRELAARGLDVVYGGTRVGLMAILADSALEAGGRVTGVITDLLQEKGIGHPGLSELIVVETMHQRKARMMDLADGFIALPGGLGTLEELSEVLTWAQLGYHGKPSGLLNVNRYYDPLAAFLDHAVTEGFIKPFHRDMIMMEENPAVLLDRFEAHRPQIVDKWTARPA